jgi:tRNA A-37 threonylcarbamoyl transferase component Bud32
MKLCRLTHTNAIIPTRMARESTSNIFTVHTLTSSYFTARIIALVNSFVSSLRRKYSREAHQYCADQGVAPEVYAIESLPGGWTMVVMEFVDNKFYKHLRFMGDERLALTTEVQRVVSVLHRGNFVHGDVRDVNLMVHRNWKSDTQEKKVLLIDFDWAGPKDITRYPPNVNTDIYRPEGAIDGHTVTQEHDLAMLKYIFDGPPSAPPSSIGS